MSIPVVVALGCAVVGVSQHALIGGGESVLDGADISVGSETAIVSAQWTTANPVEGVGISVGVEIGAP